MHTGICKVYIFYFLVRPSQCPEAGNFAQWRYSNQWSNREVLLLLVENYNQYPALLTLNVVDWGNFCMFLREPILSFFWIVMEEFVNQKI